VAVATPGAKKSGRPKISEFTVAVRCGSAYAKDLGGELDQDLQQPRHADDEGAAHEDELRHEGERLLLDLGDRLDDRDHQAHAQRDEQHGRRDHERGHDCVAGEVDDELVGHGRSGFRNDVLLPTPW
jgi:hypothetical protein